TVEVVGELLADNETLGTASAPLASGTTDVSAGEVLTGDTLNGVQVTTANTDVTPITTGNILIDADGNVTIAANTPTGSYDVEYEICESGANPDNCTKATVTVEVVGELLAVVDKFTSINGKYGDITVSVLENDTLNGVKVIPSEVNLTVVNIAKGLTLNFDGTITVAPGTTSGTYDYSYEICEKLNPSNCSTVISKVVVGEAPILAVSETFTEINGKDGGKTASLLQNDKLNGQPVVIADVNLSILGTLPTGLTLDVFTGEIIVVSGTVAGDYNVEYSICEKLNPVNCSTVISKVVVESVVTIIPVIDDYTETPVSIGGVIENVTANDILNGNPVVIGTAVGEVTLTPDPNGTNPDGFIFDENGNITIAPDTAAGDYIIEYEICENGLISGNCETTTVKITVKPVSTIDLIIDDYNQNPTGVGETTEAVTDNDTLNGNPVVIGTELGAVTLTPDPNETNEDGFTFNADGTITVAPDATPGTYDLEYQICENGANPINCKVATVTIVVVSESLPCGTPYNIMTPDNDGDNDVFFISCIDKPEYANNRVEIFN
ncbi:hypothetical protein F7648_11625, partial [Tenacibaculum piscium]|nr:hypothetical protein [Tenacibaculum piscium]